MTSYLTITRSSCCDHTRTALIMRSASRNFERKSQPWACNHEILVKNISNQFHFSCGNDVISQRGGGEQLQPQFPKTPGSSDSFRTRWRAFLFESVLVAFTLDVFWCGSDENEHTWAWTGGRSASDVRGSVCVRALSFNTFLLVFLFFRSDSFFFFNVFLCFNVFTKLRVNGIFE